MAKMNINEKKLVLARMKWSDDDYDLSIGSQGTFSKNDLIKNIENETEVGKQIVQIQMEYLRDLVSGDFYKILEI